MLSMIDINVKSGKCGSSQEWRWSLRWGIESPLWWKLSGATHSSTNSNPASEHCRWLGYSRVIVRPCFYTSDFRSVEKCGSMHLSNSDHMAVYITYQSSDSRTAERKVVYKWDLCAYSTPAMSIIGEAEDWSSIYSGVSTVSWVYKKATTSLKTS